MHNTPREATPQNHTETGNGQNPSPLPTAIRTSGSLAEKIAPPRLPVIHRFSGMIMVIFITIHLFNHLFGLVSVEAHLSAMHYARLLYRNLIAETILLLAVCIQALSGITLVRRKAWKGLSFPERAQVASGSYLAFFLIAHVFAVMMGRFFFRLDTNFYFASATLFSPLWLFYVVYYGLSVLAVFTHIASIHYLKMHTKHGATASIAVQSWLIIGVGSMIAIAILLAFSGILYDIAVPDQYMWW